MYPLNMIEIVFALLNTPLTRVVLTVISCKHIIKVNYQNNELFTVTGVNICMSPLFYQISEVLKQRDQSS
jgi:hypothetical protein